MPLQYSINLAWKLDKKSESDKRHDGQVQSLTHPQYIHDKYTYLKKIN